jgi:rubrerythrin
MSARREAQPRPLRPAFGDPSLRAADKDDFELHKPRFVFSPFKRITEGLEQTGLDAIEPGVITLVKDFKYPIRNVRKVETNDEDEPEMTRHARAAGHIVAGLMRNHGRDGNLATGFIEFPELMGLDPESNPQDAALVIDLQELLLPNLPETGFKQLDFLMSRERAAKQKGAQYSATLKRMAEATNTAIDFNRSQAAEIRDEMAQRASGQKGYRGKLYEPDSQIFEWIEEEPPALQSPFAKRQDAALIVQQSAPAAAPALEQVQCDNCGAFANLIVKTGKPPKACTVCNQPFEDETPPADEEASQSATSTAGKAAARPTTTPRAK